MEAVPVSAVPGRRTPDFRVGGVPVELKTVGSVRIAGLVGEGLTKKLSGAIASRIMDARGQAPNVVVDLREQEGITPEREPGRAGLAHPELISHDRPGSRTHVPLQRAGRNL